MANAALPAARGMKRQWRGLRTAAFLLFGATWYGVVSTAAASDPIPAPVVDAARARAAGIRRLEGKHLVLYTDLPSRPAVDELPRVFDAAIEPWCRYLGIDPTRLSQWRMTGFLMSQKQRFQRLGLLPSDLPHFDHGFHRGWAMWAYDKPSDYYRRHIVLHEGVHAVMRHFLGGTGRPWFREGMAELLSTHRWDGRKLSVNVMPKDRGAVPLWGRIKVIRTAVEAGRPLDLWHVIRYPEVLHTDQYAWCWAACYFLSHHPRYRDRFPRLLKICHQPVRFQSEVAGLFPPADPILREDWQLFVSELDYGFDIDRSIVLHRPARPLVGASRKIELDVTRSWQSTGVVLEAGRRYEVSCAGRFQVARPANGSAWESEPQGVTIEYYRGRPIGMVVAAVRPERLPPRSLSPLLSPVAVGRETVMVVRQRGVLYVRINESPSKLADNRGRIEVTVKEMPASP